MGIQGHSVYTDVTLENATGESLSLFSMYNWYGTANLPLVIPPLVPQKIKHDADPYTGCSKGAVAYALSSGIKWIVFWSNMAGESNKVYMDLVPTGVDIDWESYRTLLDNSTHIPAAVNKFEYTTMASIDPSSVTPILMATLAPPPPV